MKPNHMFHTEISCQIYIFLAGCISGAILLPYVTRSLKRAIRYLSLSKNGNDHLYGLDHGILNVGVPPVTMWMNMGFWEQSTSFPAACRALLDEVLMAAGLLGLDKMPQTKSTSFKIIDLGFGCGDQSIYLAKLAQKARQTGERAGTSSTRYLLSSYVGLTIVPSQFRFASERVQTVPHMSGDRIKLFCADAANPNTWTRDIHEAATDTLISTDHSNVSLPTRNMTTWVLALDTLYHFIPSREPIFRHAFRELNASIMAFDLVLSDTPSIKDLVILRLICYFAATPFSNFITVSEYRNRLIATGYDKENIEIKDISKHVFNGISSFIERQDAELRSTGMTIGRYRGAGKVFRWWARSGVVRGCIVVARR